MSCKQRPYLSHKPVVSLVLAGLDFTKPSVVQLRRCLQSERAFACRVHEQRPKLRQPSACHGTGQQRPAGRALQGAPPNATGMPEASLEACIRTHDRQQACPAGCAKRPCPTVQPGSAESGLCLGYHVHPYRHRLALLGCRARPVLAQSRGLGQWRRVCQLPWFAMPCAWRFKRGDQRPDWSSTPTEAANMQATSTRLC
jgi:hypothetical protein